MLYHAQKAGVGATSLLGRDKGGDGGHRNGHKSLRRASLQISAAHALRGKYDSFESKDWFDAIRNGEFATVKYLLVMMNVDVNMKDEFGKTGLHWSAMNPVENVQIVKEILQAPSGMSDVLNNVDDCDGNTAVHLASMYNRLDMLRYLLAKGADATIKNRFGSTPLDLATHFRHSDCIELLVMQKKNIPSSPAEKGVENEVERLTPIEEVEEGLCTKKNSNKYHKTWKDYQRIESMNTAICKGSNDQDQAQDQDPV